MRRSASSFAHRWRRGDALLNLAVTVRVALTDGQELDVNSTGLRDLRAEPTHRLLTIQSVRLEASVLHANTVRIPTGNHDCDGGGAAVLPVDIDVGARWVALHPHRALVAVDGAAADVTEHRKQQHRSGRSHGQASFDIHPAGQHAKGIPDIS